MSIANSLKFGFSLFCRVLLLAFFSYLFYFVLFFLVISNWVEFSYFQRPTANIIKKAYNAIDSVHHGKLNRQNRNKMSEDRQRKLTVNHQQFNNRIKQLIGQNETRFTDPNNTKRKQQLIIISFSPFFLLFTNWLFPNKMESH